MWAWSAVFSGFSQITLEVRIYEVWVEVEGFRLNETQICVHYALSWSVLKILTEQLDRSGYAVF